MKAQFFSAFLLTCILACGPGGRQTGGEDAPFAYPTTGSIERLQPELDAWIPAEAQIEVLATGFRWSEGPLWAPALNSLLFTDVPANRIYRWQEGDTAATVYLEPSGFTGETTRSREPGANGLALDAEGRLVLCQHGDRRIARMDAPLDQPAPNFVTLADRYEGMRFNSPNDLVYDTRGNLYFTDPPYGLADNVNDPEKEMPYQGVFKLSPNGTLALLDTLTRPNGIALSPNENVLYVAISDPKMALWMAYDLSEEGVSNRRVLLDMTHMVGKARGLPDGLKVDPQGNLWATGPGGVLIISPEGVHLGTIQTGQPTANCAFTDDFSTLYMTANNQLMRINLK